MSRPLTPSEFAALADLELTIRNAPNVSSFRSYVEGQIAMLGSLITCAEDKSLTAVSVADMAALKLTLERGLKA